MHSRKIAWVLLAIGAVLMGGTWLAIRFTGSSPERPATAAPQPGNVPAADAPDAPPPAADAPDADAPRPADDDPRPDAGAPAAPPARWATTNVQGATFSDKHIIGSANPGSGYRFQIETVAEGGAIYTAKLADYQTTVADKELADEFPDTYSSIWQDKGEGYLGPYSLMNPVRQGDGVRLPFATRSMTFQSPDWSGSAGAMARQRWEALEPVRTDDSESQTYRYEVYRNGALVLRVLKTYTVRKGDWSMEVTLAVENLAGEPVTLMLDQAGPTGVPREDERGDQRQGLFGRRKADSEAIEVQRVAHAGGYEGITRDEGGPGDRNYIGRSDQAAPVAWIGQANKFFAALMHLRPGDAQQIAAAEAKADFYWATFPESDTSNTLLTGVVLGREAGEAHGPALTLEPGKTETFRFDVFLGPKKRDLFADQQAYPLYVRMNYRETIDVSSGCFCSIEPLARGMLWLLEKLAWLSLGNWGVAIILLVLLVRAALHPLSRKAQVSMAQMQKIAPQVKKLQEKYADDKATQQREMMKLYREAGASPFLGCLPMLLQMPIWIALWTSINVSVDLRHAAFLPFWLTDLSTPDQLITWSAEAPLIGHSFNLLPILLAVAMYLQMKLTPQMSGGSAVATTPEQKAQQRMMQIMMPAMMLIFFYKAPSGLTLYIMASTFAGVIESKVIRKHIREKEAAEAARETVVTGPGKGARAARPKKPKGPFWFKGGK